MNTSLFIFTPKENLKAVIDLLRYINYFLRHHNLTYWVISATLLGAVRNGMMLPWYDDADISMDYQMIPLLYEKLKTQKVIAIRELPDRKRIFWKTQENEEYPYPFVDLFPCICDQKYVTYQNDNAFLNLFDEWFTYNEIFSLKEWKFEDFQVWGPNDPYRYLDKNFGRWRTHGRTNGYVNSTRKRVDIVEFKI